MMMIIMMITVMMMLMTQVNLAQSGMGLASVEQKWSCFLPNLLVKDQVLLLVVIVIVIGIFLISVTFIMVWLQAGYPVFHINLPRWCVCCADLHFKVTSFSSLW